MKRVTSFNWHEKSFFLIGIMAATLFFVWAGMLQNPPSLAARAFAPSPGGGTGNNSGLAGSPTIREFSVLKDIGAQVYYAPPQHSDVTLHLPTSHPETIGDGSVSHSDVIPPTEETTLLEASGQEPAWSKGKVSLTYFAEGPSTWSIYSDPFPAHVPLYASGLSCKGDTTAQQVRIGIAGGEFETPGLHTVECDIYTDLILPEQLTPIDLVAEVSDISDDGDDSPPLTLGAPRVAGSMFQRNQIKLLELVTEKPASEKPTPPGSYQNEVETAKGVLVSETALNPTAAYQDYTGEEMKKPLLCKKEVLSCMIYIKKLINANYHAFAHQIEVGERIFCVPTNAKVKFTDANTNTSSIETVKALDHKGRPAFHRIVQVFYPQFRNYPSAPNASATINAWGALDRKVHEEAHVAIVKKTADAAQDAIEKKVFSEFETILTKQYNYGVNRLHYPFAKIFIPKGEGPGICAQTVEAIAEQAVKNVIGSADDAYDPEAVQNKAFLVKEPPATLLGREEHANRVEDKGEGTLKVYAVEENPLSTKSVQTTQEGSFNGRWHLKGGPSGDALSVGDEATLHTVSGKPQIRYQKTK